MAVACTYVGDTTSTDDSDDYTFTDHAVGSAAADRKTVVVAMGIQQGSSALAPTMTIGGNAANLEITQLGVTEGNGNRAIVAIFSLDNPTGTTATIVLDWGDPTFFDSTIFVYAVTGAASGAAAATDGDADEEEAASISAALNVVADGGIIAGELHYWDDTATPATTWTGATEDDQAPSLYNTEGRSAASLESGAGATPQTVTATFAGPLAPVVSSAAIAAVAFSPAAAGGLSIPIAYHHYRTMHS